MKHKHLSFDDRLLIEECLLCGLSFKHIAMRLDKDPSTISKEIKKHFFLSGHSTKKDSNGHPLHCPLLSKPPFVCNSCPKNLYLVGILNKNTLLNMLTMHT